jgi:hypothetical protein
MEKYIGDFSSWDGVKREFRIDDEEPDVVYAEYEQEYYEGWAWVVYRDGDNIYLVEGGHCSCYGLEGQWDPEEYTLETFISMLDRAAATPYPYGIGKRTEEIKKRLGV